MTAGNQASRIVTAAARRSLRPLGLTQRGRSRCWIDDHGWWIGIVAFAPPRTAGSGLQVGAMWLWQDTEHLVYNAELARVGSEYYRDDQQFTPLAEDLARRAAAEVATLRESFTDLRSVARDLLSRPPRRGWLWEDFDAGVAAALTGDPGTAVDRFDRILAEEPYAPWMVDAQQRTRELRAIAPDQAAVVAWAAGAVESCRAKLKLPPVPDITEQLTRIS